MLTYSTNTSPHVSHETPPSPSLYNLIVSCETQTLQAFLKNPFLFLVKHSFQKNFTTKESCFVSHETLHLDNELLFHMKQFQKALLLIHSYANLIDPIFFLFFRSNNVSCETSILTALKTIESRNFPKERQMFFHISLLSVKTVSRETNF